MKPSELVRMGACALALASLPAFADTWSVPGDFATIQDAIDSPLVINGDTIRVGPGEFAGALVDKSVEIKGEGDAVINDGPEHPSGLIQGFRLLAGSGGATFSHLEFMVDLSIMNGEAVDDVTVTQCHFENALQAVSNWRGSRWEITHNTIHDLRTRNGGGIGILVADYNGGTVSDNVVSHNKITGTLHVDPADGGGYSGTGIVIYADFRWGRTGAAQIEYNRVVKNKVDLVSDTPSVVDVVAFELTDTRDDPDLGPVLYENIIGFNDWRDMTNQISLTPTELGTVNVIDRNMGDNRGHGMYPASMFNPN